MKKSAWLAIGLLLALLPVVVSGDDRSGPIVTWNAPAEGSCWQIGGREVNLGLEFSAEDDSGVKQGVIWMKAGHHGLTSDRSSWSRIWGHTYASGSSAPPSLREIIMVRMAGRSEGEYTFLAEFADMAHHNTTAKVLHVAVDFTSPTVAITSPANGRVVCRDLPLKVKVDAGDGSGCGVSHVQLFLQGATAATPYAVDSTPPYEFTVAKANLAVDSLRLTAKAIDRSGRSSQAEITVKPTLICVARATR